MPLMPTFTPNPQKQQIGRPATQRLNCSFKDYVGKLFFSSKANLLIQ